jgi:hypothetical protein
LKTAGFFSFSGVSEQNAMTWKEHESEHSKMAVVKLKNNGGFNYSSRLSP